MQPCRSIHATMQLQMCTCPPHCTTCCLQVHHGCCIAAAGVLGALRYQHTICTAAVEPLRGALSLPGRRAYEALLGSAGCKDSTSGHEWDTCTHVGRCQARVPQVNEGVGEGGGHHTVRCFLGFSTTGAWLSEPQVTQGDGGWGGGAAS